jgi:predicted nucleic acid-binding protein
MEIVVDTNVIISSLLRNGLTRKIIFLSPLKMYTVDYAKTEIEAHKEELLIKSKLDERSLNYLNEFIFSKIDLVPLKNIEPFRNKAEEIMSEIDIDDSFFLALAMSLNCPVWSNDAHLKMQSVIKVYTTKELLDFLRTL